MRAGRGTRKITAKPTNNNGDQLSSHLNHFQIESHSKQRIKLVIGLNRIRFGCRCDSRHCCIVVGLCVDFGRVVGRRWRRQNSRRFVCFVRCRCRGCACRRCCCWRRGWWFATILNGGEVLYTCTLWFFARRENKSSGNDEINKNTARRMQERLTAAVDKHSSGSAYIDFFNSGVRNIACSKLFK
jgi:hypothetical protein